jgi:hypothetical protein
MFQQMIIPPDASRSDALRTVEFWGWTIGSLTAFIVFVCWVELSPSTLGPLTPEDGPIENASALLFLVSGIGFLIAAARSEWLRSQGTWGAYLMILAWAGLAFVFAGEEISWGQRILGLDTPEQWKAINAQEEFNIHNLYIVGVGGGSTYRYLTMFAITTGLVLPLMAMTSTGRRLFQRFHFPVAPIVLAPAFIGAYLFGKYYLDIAPSAGLSPKDAVNEVRELLIGYAMALYGMYGALLPDRLFAASRISDRRMR